MFILFVAATLFLVHIQSTHGLAVENTSKRTITAQIKPTINGTVELSTFCRTCPYNLCVRPDSPSRSDTYELSCWTEGDLVGDSNLWLKTNEQCYVPEYDLVEYEGDFSAELEFCGHIPLRITKQPATVQYLSECKWGYYTSDETIKYYGRDLDVTLTCWAEGATVMDDYYWYQTLDLCWVSGSGLWDTPDRDRLEWCGPEFGPRLNESDGANDPNDLERGPIRRWLQPEQIGEEYAGCYTHPSSVTNATNHRETIYEFNQTVVSQCYIYGDGYDLIWMLTTDWCYVNSTEFWVPPYDNYRYPNCNNWNLEAE